MKLWPHKIKALERVKLQELIMQVLTPLLFGPEVLKFSSNPRRIVIVKFNLLDRHNRV